MESEELLELHENLINVSSELLDLWNLLIFGDYTKGQTPILLRYGKVDDMIQGHGCSQLTNSTLKTCYGLDELVKAFVLSSHEINERVNNKGPNNYIQTFDDLIDFYFRTNILTSNLFTFLDIFVSSSSANLVISILVFVAASIMMMVLTFLIHNSIEKTEQEVNQVRSLLNYVPVDNLDAKEELRTYVLHNSLPSLIHRNHTDSNDDNVRNMLNAAVDGAVMCNDKGDIEIFNPAASRIHGRQADEVLGRPFWILFDTKYHDEIKSVMSLMIKGNHLNHAGETKEVEGLRKNGTKFPAIITISGTTYDSKVIYICFIKDISSEKKQNALLAEEKKNSENLLKNILPSAVAQKLKAGETFIAEKFSDVTCFFSDMVGFTSISSKMGANELVGMLNAIVNGFDALTEKYDLEKIKTIGDAYFATGGLWQTSDHPERVLMFALDTFYVIRTYNTSNIAQQLRKIDNLDAPDIHKVIPQIDIRIGINTGECVAGVIGTKKFAYDLWGDTINVASRMESTSKPGQVQISRSTFERVHDLPKLKFEERFVEVKGKGKMQSYLVDPSCHDCAKLNEETIKVLIDEEKSLRNELNPRESFDLTGGNVAEPPTTL
ncbi:predicted protein [Naegleria gruberi]|uniref:Predicted protein n=1 Tax=Naegleria gruberi TaxID=5762 RepID=D2W0U4_NAEGR|nr:uncharacterized protein NAEGRDRAFT_74983 [Naegleria gruberi]EFC37349.1 predicted protein [Naegleria gruberi]|eukprot:XP_002670093.1 predicted protein [Naegleria gruberi strain NEG-M]